MRSAEALRRALGPDCPLTVAQIERAQAELYPLAQQAVALYRTRPAQARDDAQSLPVLSEDKQLDLEERAAVLEFDGGLPREKAEHKAAADWHRERK